MLVEIRSVHFLTQCQLNILNVRRIGFLLQLRIHIALVSLCRNRTRIRSLKRIKVRLRHLLPKFGSHLSIDSLLILVLANVQNLMSLGKNAICRSRFGTR